MGRNVAKIGEIEDYSIYKINGKEYRIRDFSEINTKEEAYFIGYLLGDGAYARRSKKKLEKISISSIEEYIIKFFKQYFQPDNNYRSRIPVNKTRNIVTETYSHIMPISSVLSDTFVKYQIMGLKEDRRFCELSSESLMKSYILGLIDSDGYVSYHYGFNSSEKDRKENDKRTVLKHAIGITHPATEMLVSLNLYLTKILGINGIVDKKSDEKCMIYRINSRPHIKVLIEWLYSDLPMCYNIDKKNKMISLLEILNTPIVNMNGVNRSASKSKETYRVNLTKDYLIGTFDNYDEAVKQRILSEIQYMDTVNTTQNYNSHSKQFEIKYINPQDNTINELHINLNKKITKFQKLSQ